MNAGKQKAAVDQGHHRADAPHDSRWARCSSSKSDEKYTRVVMADGEALIKTPIRELIDGLDPKSSGRSTARRW
jgi:hypothetical protein